MKKLKSTGGFTLMEVLASMLILTFLVIGMGPGMKTAMTVYRESTFQSSSTALIGAMNTTLGDVLRFAEDVEVAEDGTFTFTNVEYGLRNGRFLQWDDDTGPDVVTVIDHNGEERLLLPEGAYPNMEISEFSIRYNADTDLVEVNYTIESTVAIGMKREAACTIAFINEA